MSRVGVDVDVDIDCRNYQRTLIVEVVVDLWKRPRRAAGIKLQAGHRP